MISCDNNVITKTEITADNFTQMREKRPRSQMPKVEGIEGYEKFGRKVPVKLRKLAVGRIRKPLDHYESIVT